MFDSHTRFAHSGLLIDLLHSCPWGILGSLWWTPVRPERVVRGFFRSMRLCSESAAAAGQKKSESSTSHKTLSSGIVYQQTGITAPPPPPTFHPALTTLSHTCKQKVPSLPLRIPPASPAPTHAPASIISNVI